ncbi:MAG: hypothetical protein HXX81_01060 [Campylobacterales bacterium]|nr:hypothetical protein [Campylobacterales bacterium]
MEDVELKKELAKYKRLASDIASQIHDIVEDTMWAGDYKKMPELSQELCKACEEYFKFKKEHNL